MKKLKLTARQRAAMASMLRAEREYLLSFGWKKLSAPERAQHGFEVEAWMEPQVPGTGRRHVWDLARAVQTQKVWL